MMSRKNNKVFMPRDTRYAVRDTSKRAFTLIELMAAVGMLAMIIAFTSIIFRFGIDAHRVSVANAEIMQKARAITEQLNSDFSGLRKDAPLFIWFKQDDPLNLQPDEDPNRYDQIMFFADGDFSSLQLYDRNDGEPLDPNEDIGALGAVNVKVIRGNLARIQYTHSTNTNDDDIEDIEPIDRFLSRRTHILFNNSDDWELEGWPDFNNMEREINGRLIEDYYEHDTLIMADWRHPKNSGSSNVENIYETEIIPNIFTDYLPKVDKTDPATLHLLLCENVSSLAVHFAYWGRDNNTDDWELRWFPADNPNGNVSNSDSHFDIDAIENSFGLFFNLTGINDITSIDWYNISQIKDGWSRRTETDKYKSIDYPIALKFTFTIYDKHNFIEGGRTFTHIIYLED